MQREECGTPQVVLRFVGQNDASRSANNPHKSSFFTTPVLGNHLHLGQRQGSGIVVVCSRPLRARRESIHAA